MAPSASRRGVPDSAEPQAGAHAGETTGVTLSSIGVLAALVGLLPFGALRYAGAAIGWLAGSVLRIRRRHVERAMVDAGILHASRAAAGMYRALGASLVELLWLAARPDEPASAWAALDDASRAALGEALARGRGVVLAASHTGNWELAAAALAESSPFTAVAKRMSVGAVDRFVRAARTSRAVHTTTRDGAMDRARRALRGRGIVAMMIDQVPDRARHGVAAPFLGATALVDKAPAALAAAMRPPMVVAAAARDPDGAQRVQVLAVLDPPEKARRAWIDEATREATRALDAFVRAHPTEWLWMHRRWRSPRS
jgi:KDO2-lipid IV(A) lauroyltransferase